MSDQLISLAIDQISKENFEIWVQHVLQVTEGYAFEPTGGIHDGGQDGFVRLIGGAPNHFVQISKQSDTRTKIRTTIEDIRKHREIKRITYVTSNIEPQRDILEAKWGKEFDIRIIIHDQRWLLIQAGLYENIRNSLYGYVRQFIDSVDSARDVKRELNLGERLSIITYLEAQALSLPSSESFQNICLDTVIYRCLSGTDPQRGLFKSLDEIEIELNAASPSVVKKAPSSIVDRINFLASKQNFPRIRRHPNLKYALPYDVRNQFDVSNIALKSLEDGFLGSIGRRAREECKDRADLIVRHVIPAVRFAIDETFKRQAINFVNSFSAVAADTRIEVFSILDEFFSSTATPEEFIDECKAASSNVFRRVCYSSNANELSYLNLLMKYFSIKFVMDGDVAVTQYFSEMAKRLKIYLGSDIIVRCLSEVLVRENSRGMTNALRKLQQSGVKLHLTRQVLDEVYSHIHLSYTTFRNHYEKWYRLGSLEEVKNCEKILIRAFFYAYFEPENHVGKPRDWSDFLSQFGHAAWFVEPERNKDDFGSFLIDKYGLSLLN